MRILCKEECLINVPTSKGKGWTLLSGLLVLLMPKCAFCWAAYASLLSSVGVVINYQSWFVPVAAVLFLLTLIKLLIVAVRRKNFVSFGLALVAGSMILLQRKVPGMNTIKIFAIICMIVAIQTDSLMHLYKYLSGRRFATEAQKH